ncbi:DUF3344 domain-containing protein [Streptomyces sp. NPDC005805]|uniref:DUF3344 domain-containing protein n=1 Tax=Streptomyces sp. NPDC005805 TaxID=3157068 RepID=UPI0033C6B663
MSKSSGFAAVGGVPRFGAGRAGRGIARWGALLCAAVTLAPATAAAAPPPVPAETPRIPFVQRYHAVHHGGVTRIANSAITCRTPLAEGAAACPALERGAAGANSDYEMFYVDLDDDPNTYNSTRAELALPAGSTVRYARLYWGGNLRVGEQKPPKDNGRVLIAEPGGRYKEVLADTRIAHRDADGRDAYQASADITPLVRDSRSGYWTVSQLNVARGHSKAGAWGGWTMVVAYENDREPLRDIALWDGFETVGEAREVTLTGLRAAPGATGRAGLVAYDGDRGATGESATVRAGNGPAHRLTDAANSRADLMNSTITDLGRPNSARKPAHRNTLGYDSDVYDISSALRRGADSLAFRFTGERNGYFLGALFVQADARR